MCQRTVGGSEFYRGMLPCWPRVAGAAGDGRGDRGAGRGRLDHLVDDADLLRPGQPAGELLVLDRQLLLDLAAHVGRHLGQPAAVQDAHRGHRAHDGHLGARPGEHPGRAERAGVHRDVGAAVGLAGHQRHPRHGRLGEGVQQLGAAAYDAVPLLADAGQVAGHVDDDDHRHAERVAHPHEPRRLLRRRRVQAAAEPQRVVGDDADGAAAEPAQRGGDVRRPLRVQLERAALVEQVLDDRVHVVGALGATPAGRPPRSTSGDRRRSSRWSPSSAASRRASA